MFSFISSHLCCVNHHVKHCPIYFVTGYTKCLLLVEDAIIYLASGCTEMNFHAFSTEIFCSLKLRCIITIVALVYGTILSNWLLDVYLRCCHAKWHLIIDIAKNDFKKRKLNK